MNILKLMPGKVLPLEVHYEFDAPEFMDEYDALFGTTEAEADWIAPIRVL